MRIYLPYLRIAWTVACGVACVLLIVLWVRSYTWRDDIWWQLGTVTHYAGSYPGHLGFAESIDPFESTWSVDWNMRSERMEVGTDASKILESVSKATGPFIRPRLLPIWLPILIATSLSIAPWLRWRFTLRTLLIVTTLVAVVLGLIVWALHG
jgi:hypothetical protein